MKILISGGHLTPALALIDYLVANHPDTQVLFAGRLYSQDATRQPSHEADEVTRRGVTFIPFKAPRLSHLQQWWIWFLIGWRLAISVVAALRIVWRYRPDVMVSFGGYLALPLAISCYLWRVPIVTHEQTRGAGSANRFISRLAKKVAVAYPESTKFFPPTKTIVTGNPIRRQLLVKQPRPSWIPAELTKPVLYITGGNQGSSIINVIVQQALKQLTKNWTVIHQCGAPTSHQNYLAELTRAKAQLSAANQERYWVKEWVSESELGWIYQHATMVVSRAGANTVNELTVLHLPAIFIPLPFAHFDEQTINAESIVKVGGAVLIPQKELTAKSLVAAVDKVFRFRKSMANKLKDLQLPLDADHRLYQVIEMVTSA